MAEVKGTRQNVCDTFLAARKAPKTDCVMASLQFGDSIRDLSNPQAAALAALLYEFEVDKRRDRTAPQYLLQAAAKEI